MNTADPQQMFGVLFTEQTRTARMKLPDHPFFGISTFQAEKPLSTEKIPIVSLFANVMPFFLLRSCTGLQLPASPIIKAAFSLKKPHTSHYYFVCTEHFSRYYIPSHCVHKVPLHKKQAHTLRATSEQFLW